MQEKFINFASCGKLDLHQKDYQRLQYPHGESLVFKHKGKLAVFESHGLHVRSAETNRPIRIDYEGETLPVGTKYWEMSFMSSILVNGQRGPSFTREYVLQSGIMGLSNFFHYIETNKVPAVNYIYSITNPTMGAIALRMGFQEVPSEEHSYIARLDVVKGKLEEIKRISINGRPIIDRLRQSVRA